MERVLDYITDVKPRWTAETADMLFYDDMLALKSSADYGYDDELWDDDCDDEEDGWDENM